MSQVILEKTQGSCRTILLNRPKRLNAFNFELAQGLSQALLTASGDPKIRVVVLRGSEAVFSAGGDLKLFHENLATSDLAFKKISTLLNEAIEHITTMSKPVIAAIQGPAYAAGFGVALACDLVVASHNAKLSPSFINIALAPNASSTFFLPRILGPRLAMEALFRGQVFSAVEAKDLGLVNHVWSEEVFEDELKNLIQDLSNRPTLSLGRIKKLVHQTFQQPMAAQLELEKEEIAASSLSEDFKEGVTAFVEKRRPNFKGK